MTLATTPKRARIDGPIETGSLTTDDRLTWRIGVRAMKSTPVRAVTAAAGRVRNSRDGLVLLDGLWVNESDLIALMAAVKRGYTTTRLCMACHTQLADDGHCPECIREQTEGDE